MKKLSFTLGLFCIAIVANSQSMDCDAVLKYRKASPPWQFSALSKGLQCSTNNTYEQGITLKPGMEYRISFYASTIFNNRMHFKIVDVKSGKALMDLPGETVENKQGECVLKEYWDYRIEKSVYPYFEFSPKETQELKIIIEIPEYKEKIKIRDKDENLGVEEEWREYSEKRKGCVGIFIQEMKTE
ncbi:MAG: hypothetical protein U0W24_15610 [Bacteroidales bacterium]